MRICRATLPEILIAELDTWDDERGFFCETYQKERYCQAGLPTDFVQDNFSYSVYGVIRGMHCQNPQGQGKLIYVTLGCVWDVAVDIRCDSPRFGQWTAVELSAQNKKQLYIPPGFAHGFCVLSPEAHFVYKCSDFYNRDCEIGFRWDDPEVGISWPIQSPCISDKDRQLPRLGEIPQSKLPRR